MEKKGAFDYILLETTGLADPGNLAPLFWVDEGLGSTIYLDGIVTLVDAKNILRSLDDPQGKIQDHNDHDDHGKGPLMTTAHVQISHADVIVINKSDLVSKEELDNVKSRIQSINAIAKLHTTEKSIVPQLEGFLLDLHAYDEFSEVEVAAKGHSHLDPVSKERPKPFSHIHPFLLTMCAPRIETISTVSIPVPTLRAEHLDRVDEWLRSILWENKLPGVSEGSNWEIHRCKGRLIMESGEAKMLQGVREVFELIDAPQSEDLAGVKGKIIFIGRQLAGVDFEQSFTSAII